ncbi:hypothetical protein [Persicobacter sp. CCB-QB2]|uniref:hypothetical protein n=1 Tax=Persicobacter sp. CCB-QB2 TaxID=1561025 RepID=UPI0006A971CF|nr:hypothetical protein [Persicobacter sp. CCB-QB2]
MKNIIIYLIVLTSFACAKKETTKEVVVGIWQKSPVMASGWVQSYTFFPDGKFIYRKSQGDQLDRELSSEGIFKISNDTLTLETQLLVKLEGGQIVNGPFDDKVIEGAKETQTLIKPATIEKFFLPKIELDENFQKLKMEIGETTFWKFRDNPNEYE